MCVLAGLRQAEEAACTRTRTLAHVRAVGYPRGRFILATSASPASLAWLPRATCPDGASDPMRVSSSRPASPLRPPHPPRLQSFHADDAPAHARRPPHTCARIYAPKREEEEGMGENGKGGSCLVKEAARTGRRTRLAEAHVRARSPRSPRSPRPPLSPRPPRPPRSRGCRAIFTRRRLSGRRVRPHACE